MTTNTTTAQTTQTTSPVAGLRLNHAFVLVDDMDAGLAFYHGVLGLPVATDVTTPEGFRWLSLGVPGQPGLEIVLQLDNCYPGITADDERAIADLRAKGFLSTLIFSIDDVDALFERVRASGADVLQEPTDQFYGVRDCAFRDPAGNMVRFNQPSPTA
ncbi:MAG: VOC family protein [Austwickia sp.]|jgi:catechol 2,3-dioxygenase-like lactoylglutathione lyase family enzyme|nr:MAG: VOC family protein [Austwickia sp.]